MEDLEERGRRYVERAGDGETLGVEVSEIRTEVEKHALEHTVTNAMGTFEAGTMGAASAVLNAVNDALAPLGAAPIASLPITPEIVLKALGKVA